MATLALTCSLPLQPPSASSQSQSRKLVDTILSTPAQYSSSSSNSYGSLKPIVVNGDPPTFVSAPGRRIVAVGDLHGDLDKARGALETAGVLSSDGQDFWIGGETVLIQLGDILDRGEDELAILSLLKSLDIQAKAHGGAVFQRQKGVIARSILMRPGGPLACELARHGVVLKVDDWLFCHGGLLPHHVAYGLERLNREVSQWMKGPSEADDSPQMPFIATRGYDSIVWNRLYSRDSDLEDYQIEQIQSLLEETLQTVGAKAMVVGHTPQPMGVNCKYDCSIWRIDVGMSSGVLGSSPEVLEIRDNKARALRSTRDWSSELQVADYT
ncbi:shewanella-like protein phosphatase 1 isoform X2 [Nicotiana tabacum]|uniref:Shewanella-like protein phosphatase 1 isoform X2 n=1 Tax=Nicotiana tabacum TaxID=4097 RepID=A0A1S3Z3D8_TOBAC|nr:PREDICTED: shewanella-like protein phosphatase 1 isoform X2 [Nicotiana tabacum]